LPNIYPRFSVPEYTTQRKCSINEFCHITMFSCNFVYEKYNSFMNAAKVGVFYTNANTACYS
jgi:hypothetical protein